MDPLVASLLFTEVLLVNTKGGGRPLNPNVQRLQNTWLLTPGFMGKQIKSACTLNVPLGCHYWQLIAFQDNPGSFENEMDLTSQTYACLLKLSSIPVNGNLIPGNCNGPGPMPPRAGSTLCRPHKGETQSTAWSPV